MMTEVKLKPYSFTKNTEKIYILIVNSEIWLVMYFFKSP